ncbi:hypothetical protein SBC1_26000 [Caballeronia sp. SBC1]|nr:hypothetical protein SBC1_26000 [Caballeronia sp. SBC1]
MLRMRVTWKTIVWNKRTLQVGIHEGTRKTAMLDMSARRWSGIARFSSMRSENSRRRSGFLSFMQLKKTESSAATLLAAKLWNLGGKTRKKNLTWSLWPSNRNSSRLRRR